MTLHLTHPEDEIEPVPGAARIAELCALVIDTLLREPDSRTRAVLTCAALDTIGIAVRDSLGSWGETLQ